MTEARVERRLAAILAADVAGYSRLMGADEVGTLAALKAHRRQIVDPAIAASKGRIVQTTGDGMLVEFASAVDAVTCAMRPWNQRSAIASASMSVTSSSKATISSATREQPIMVLFSNKDYSPIKDSASLIGNPCDATKP